MAPVIASFLEIRSRVCFIIPVRSDLLSKDAWRWLEEKCLRRVQCLKFVHPDLKGLSFPSLMHILHVIFEFSYRSQGYFSTSNRWNHVLRHWPFFSLRRVWFWVKHFFRINIILTIDLLGESILSPFLFALLVDGTAKKVCNFFLFVFFDSSTIVLFIERLQYTYLICLKHGLPIATKNWGRNLDMIIIPKECVFTSLTDTCLFYFS